MAQGSSRAQQVCETRHDRVGYRRGTRQTVNQRLAGLVRRSEAIPLLVGDLKGGAHYLPFNSSQPKHATLLGPSLGQQLVT